MLAVVVYPSIQEEDTATLKVYSELEVNMGYVRSYLKKWK